MKTLIDLKNTEMSIKKQDLSLWREQEYTVSYNDGAYYGTITFINKTKEDIEEYIRLEIKENNKNTNKAYHISRENFKKTK